jgi:hypothetical protein
MVCAAPAAVGHARARIPAEGSAKMYFLVHNPEMILFNLWSFAEYQGKKDNDPFYMIL